MKIIHVAEAFGGGIIDFILHLSKGLDHHEHVVIYSNRFEDFETIKSRFDSTVSFIEWKHAQRKVNIILDIKAAIFLYKILKQIPFDVIHLHSSKAGFIGRVVAFFLKKKNVIYTPNGAPFLRTDVNAFNKFFYIFLEKIGNAISGKVICSSRSEAEVYKKYGVKCSYINNGVEDKFSFQEKAKDDNLFTIVTVGRILFQKNPREFNEIANKFVNHKNIKFLWIGDGEDRSFLSSDNVTVTGWVTREEVIKHVIDSDLYLSTALWEGLPFAVLEAMSIGKPLLLSNCVGNIDLVVDNYNGFTFNTSDEASDKIKHLLHLQDLSHFQRNSYSHFINNFQVENMCSRYQEFYANIAIR